MKSHLEEELLLIGAITDDSWNVLVKLTSTPEHANTHATNSFAISLLTPGPGSLKDDKFNPGLSQILSMVFFFKNM